MTIKLIVDNDNGLHVHFRMFVGPTGQTLAKAGDLVMRWAEFQTFIARAHNLEVAHD